MQMTALDWGIVAVSLAAAFLPVLLVRRRGASSTAEYFTSGRAAPWWLVGISLVATTFSTDTPNLVTNLVRERGVANNWQWWAFLLTGMTTVFFYARLWRRCGVLTDLEFYELRYSGRAASIVRGFRAVYLGLFFNCVIMATVNLAAVKIANVVLGVPLWQTLLVCAAINIAFAATSGLWGVMYTDAVQFGIAMTGSFAAAYFALKQPQVGGLSGLFEKIDARTLALVPDFSDWGLTLSILIIPLTVQWWSVWYPGSEPGGGSYVAQRILASRNEAHAMGGTLLFNVAHYALRPWPWILVALCSLVVYPELADIQRTFPHVDPRLVGHDMAYPAMLRFLPAGWLGLMVAGLLAAYVSTIATHLNWGTSYVVHDLYRRFLRPGATERHYVAAGRWVTALLMLLAAGMTLVLEDARQGFELMMSVGAGTGLLYLLRWFWWRINAWSEVAAMVSSFTVAVGFFGAARAGYGVASHIALVTTVAVTTVVWVAVAFWGSATERAKLVAFYKLVRPAGPGWASVRAEARAVAAGSPRHGLPAGDASGVGAGLPRPAELSKEAGGVKPPLRTDDLASPDNIPRALLGWTLGCAFIYSALFGTGSFLYGHSAQGALWLAVFAASGFGLLRLLPRFAGTGQMRKSA